MANPYLKRGSSNKGSKNKSAGSKNEREGFFKKFWTKHKAIIIGASVAVISIPVGVTVWRKMQAKKLELPEGSDNTQKMLGTSDDDLMMDAMLQTTEAPSKKAEEIFPVATEQIDLSVANKELEMMPEIPDNPRANISFSASDFE